MHIKPDESIPYGGLLSHISEYSDEDNEACNTASARVYFGPLQSPEKKFIVLQQECQLAPPMQPTVDSHFRDLGQDFSENETDHEVEEDKSSRSGTPDNERFPLDGEQQN
jgi:hypothetical protein